jgi:hypothetical protein
MTRAHALRVVGWALVAVLVGGPVWMFRDPLGARQSLLERLLGPFAGTAAGIQWMRADVAWARGRHAEGYAHAASALELAPSAPGGWIFLARHFFRDRASEEREPDPALRRQWIRAAFDVLERGSAGPVAAGPDRHGALSYETGLFQAHLALEALQSEAAPGERDWPGTASELFEAAAAAFERAAERGAAHGRESAADARACAEEARDLAR